jgi:Kinase binding protein CGI-121
MAQFTFEIFESEYTLYMMYFTNVANSFSLKQNIEKFECAFINPELVCSVHQILQAANRALFNSINNMPKFQSIYLDMIYFLAPFHTVNSK